MKNDNGGHSHSNEHPVADLPSKGPSSRIYTCPMHPEFVSDKPGSCPKSGMELEPKTVASGADDDGNDELGDMTKRFWIGAALTFPVFVLAMSHIIPALERLP